MARTDVRGYRGMVLGTHPAVMLKPSSVHLVPARPIWLAPLLVAVLVAVFGWWCNTRLSETIESQLRAELTTTLDANVTALDIWITNQIKLATALTGEPQIHDLALRTLERASSF